MFEEEAARIEEFGQRLDELRKCLNVDAANGQIAELEETMAAPAFWDSPETAQKTVQQLKRLKEQVDAPDALRRELDDAEVLIELAQEAEDASMAGEITAVADDIEKRLLLSGKGEIGQILGRRRRAKGEWHEGTFGAFILRQETLVAQESCRRFKRHFNFPRQLASREGHSDRLRCTGQGVGIIGPERRQSILDDGEEPVGLHKELIRFCAERHTGGNAKAGSYEL